MAIRDLLLQELDMEQKKTRAALERVPEAKHDFAPHAKSTNLGKLSAHVAQLVKVFDGGVAAVRAALAKVPDEAWAQPWKLSMGETVFFKDTRFNAYRAMYLNHLVHHRAQLGIYLRLVGVPVPSTYGPSADESASAARSRARQLRACEGTDAAIWKSSG